MARAALEPPGVRFTGVCSYPKLAQCAHGRPYLAQSPRRRVASMSRASLPAPAGRLRMSSSYSRKHTQLGAPHVTTRTHTTIWNGHYCCGTSEGAGCAQRPASSSRRRPAPHHLGWRLVRRARIERGLCGVHAARAEAGRGLPSLLQPRRRRRYAWSTAKGSLPQPCIPHRGTVRFYKTEIKLKPHTG